MATRRTTLHARLHPLRRLVEIYANTRDIPPLYMTEAFLVCSDKNAAWNVIKQYMLDLRAAGVDEIDYSTLVPRFGMPSFAQLPLTPSSVAISQAEMNRRLDAVAYRMFAHTLPSAPPSEPPFEVNMMEALLGWKAFRVDATGTLHSPSYNATWLPGVAHEAICKNSLGGFMDVNDDRYGKCAASPTQNHSCGIYATDKIDGAISYGGANRGRIMAKVHGWGRYVRGDSGWRSQYAYPKSFHLTSTQVELVEPLKAYRVEIFIEQPLRIYDPSEDGYGIEGGINGHREDATDRYRGTTEGPSSTED